MQNFQDELQALGLDNFQVSKLTHVDPNCGGGGDCEENENDIHIHIDIDIGSKRCGDGCFNCFNCFRCGGQQQSEPPASSEQSCPPETS